MGGFCAAVGKVIGVEEKSWVGLTDCLLSAYSREWSGIGLLEVLPEHRDTFGEQIVLIGQGIDRERTQRRFPGRMVVDAGELFRITEDAATGRHNGILLARQIFGTA